MAKQDGDKKNTKVYVNQVKLRGTIMRKFRRDNWMVIGLATSTGEGRKDFPSVFWFGENVDIVDKAYNIGDHVEIDAEIQTNKEYRSQTVVGIDINDTKREIEEKMGIEGVGRFAGDENEVLLKGDLLKIYTPLSSGNKFCIATIHQRIKNKTYYPQVMLFGRQKDRIEELEEGSPVCIIGHVQTQKRKVDKKTRYHEAIVGHYIVSSEE